MENAKIEKLLKQNIEASNRTTYAVRAFVRFLFIQLVGVTAAFFLNSVATANVNPLQCAYSGDNCEPIIALQILAFLVWLAAVIWSSTEGWKELALSDPNPSRFNSVPKSEDSKSGQESIKSKTFCRHCGSEKTNPLFPCYDCGR
jgi:hypothetical protein